MKFSIQDIEELVKEALQEKQWNKDSKTPRDYDEEYNPPGSKEQEERNKRKRDKRKHDKENGECPEGEELHHTSGIENDDVECEPISKNRGRKGEGARTSKDLKVKITKSSLEEIVKEETDVALREIFGALAGAALSAAGEGAASWLGKKAGEEAMEMVVGDDEDEDDDDDDPISKRIKNVNIKTYDELGTALDAIFGQAQGLSGDSKKLQQQLATTPELVKHLKK